MALYGMLLRMFAVRWRAFVIGWIATGLGCFLAATLVGYYSLVGGFINSIWQTTTSNTAPPPLSGDKHSTAPSEAVRPSLPLATTIPAVVLILAVDLAVLWVLNHKIGNPGLKPEPDRAQFQGKFSAKLKGFAGTVSVAALGSLGSFLTMVAVTIAAVLILSRFG